MRAFAAVTNAMLDTGSGRNDGRDEAQGVRARKKADGNGVQWGLMGPVFSLSDFVHSVHDKDWPLMVAAVRKRKSVIIR